MTDDIFLSIEHLFIVYDLSIFRSSTFLTMIMILELSNNNDQYFRNIRLENVRRMFPSTSSTNYSEKEK